MKTFIKIFVCLITLLSIMSLIVLRFVSLDTFKEKISNYVKESYQLELTFNKKIIHSLLSPGSIVFNDVTVELDDKKILNFDELVIDLKLMSLINGDMTIENIMLKKMNLDINPSDIKKLKKRFIDSSKSQTTENSKQALEFRIKRLKIMNSKLVYESYQIDRFNMDSFINHKQVDISDISFDIYGGSITAKAEIKYSDVLNIKSSGKISQIDLSTWSHYLETSKLGAKGLVDLDYDLSWNQKTPLSPSGDILIQSNNLLITGMNLDKLLEGFIDSREVGLLDIASYATLGPIGAIVTNTLESGKSYPGIGRGESQIDQVYIKAKMNDGKVIMDDVALKTPEYRLAVFGKLDLIKSEYDELEIHVLNKKGCSRVFQSLSGPLSKPNIGAAKTFVKGVISPITNLFDKVKSIAGCKPVYKGSVIHP